MIQSRKTRCEAEIEHLIRFRCVERDGTCRVATDIFRRTGSAERATADCWGHSEWAHFDDKQRFKTVNMAPELRHTMEGSMMLCTGHHRAYDEGRLLIRAAEKAQGANGRLDYEWATGSRHDAGRQAVQAERTEDAVPQQDSVALQPTNDQGSVGDARPQLPAIGPPPMRRARPVGGEARGYPRIAGFNRPRFD